MPKALIVMGNKMFIPFKHSDVRMCVEMTGVFSRESQVFSYQRRNEDNSPEGEMIHVAVWPLVEHIAGRAYMFPRKTYHVVTEQVDFLIQHNGVEMPHMDRMSREDAEVPGVLLLWPDGRETIVDGNHRFVKRWLLGLSYMDFYVVTEEQIQPFLLDYPDELAPIEAREPAPGS